MKEDNNVLYTIHHKPNLLIFSSDYDIIIIENEKGKRLFYDGYYFYYCFIPFNKSWI